MSACDCASKSLDSSRPLRSKVLAILFESNVEVNACYIEPLARAQGHRLDEVIVVRRQRARVLLGEACELATELAQRGAERARVRAGGERLAFGESRGRGAERRSVLQRYRSFQRAHPDVQLEPEALRGDGRRRLRQSDEPPPAGRSTPRVQEDDAVISERAARQVAALAPELDAGALESVAS